MRDVNPKFRHSRAAALLWTALMIAAGFVLAVSLGR